MIELLIIKKLTYNLVFMNCFCDFSVDQSNYLILARTDNINNDNCTFKMTFVF